MDVIFSVCHPLQKTLFIFCWQSKHCKIKCSQTCSSLLIVAIKLTLMEISDRGSRYCLALGNMEHLIMHWSIIIILTLFCDFHCYCSLIVCARIRRILEWCSSCWYQYCQWCSKKPFTILIDVTVCSKHVISITIMLI